MEVELQTTTKHMLIDFQDTTRLSLGGTEERELIIMPEERSARAIVGQQWSCQEQEEANLHLRCESMSEEEGWNKLRGRCATKQKEEYQKKLPFRKRTEQARKWAERRFSSATSNTAG
ncbi:hypothetical protein K7X08_029779 [Anisodus acutangulus]|uniref:Uncharacterized protein n=1 Tax=Anisodus acutangulus TaxID=402998 RepID=A0A9Q1MH22_9SOLA|nr:hypothetical protein K7X08_029779 [Anisodus acutangulus]